MQRRSQPEYILLLSGLTIASGIFIYQQTCDDQTAVRWLDNLSWTVCYSIGAILAWTGASRPGRWQPVRRTLAWAATTHALGQVVWDVQVYLGETPFPGPSDLLFVLHGPIALLGMWRSTHIADVPDGKRMLWIDATGLTIASLTITLNLYLPFLRSVSSLQMAALVAYPVAEAAALATGLMLILHSGSRTADAWWHLGSQAAFAGCWLIWNDLFLMEALPDGRLLNLMFSLSSLAYGYTAGSWELRESIDSRWLRGATRFFPLVLVVVASAGMVLAFLTPGIHSTFRMLSMAGTTAVVVLSSIRQLSLVHQRERTDRELRASEYKLRSIVEMSPLSIAITKSGSREFVMVNQAFADLLGTAADQITGQNPVTLGLENPDLPAEWQSYTFLLAEAGRVDGFPLSLINRQNRKVECLLYSRKIYLDEGDFVIHLLTDVTAQKAAEREREHQNVMLAREVEHQTAELRQKNQDLAAALLELKATESQLVQSERLATLGQLISGIAHEVNTPLGAIHSAGGTLEALLESDYLRELDEYVKFSDSERVLWRKVLEGAQGWEQSLSPAEERANLKSIRETLKKLVPDGEGLAEQLSEMGMEPASVSVLLPELAAPGAGRVLQNVQVYLDMFRSVKLLNRATTRAAAVIRALKLYMHRDADAQVSPVVVDAQLETILTLYYHKYKRNVAIIKDFAANSVVYGYADELSQVWVNLINNSLQAMLYKGRLELTTRWEPDHLIVTIRDDGPGIPEAIRDRIFEAFYTTKKAGEGTGLGLHICRSIVHRHGGEIWYETSGSGTAFHVKLPEKLQEAGHR